MPAVRGIVLALFFIVSTAAQVHRTPIDWTAPVLEIRSYNLKSGTREKFHQLFVDEALPLLKRWKIDVVAYGPSLHDRDSYFLMRAFASPEDRERSEDAFYGSVEWRDGPRSAVLAAIESYTTFLRAAAHLSRHAQRSLTETLW
jgi:hypothetical protein